MERIKILRKSRGMTQAQLGETVGVIQKVIADYETGNSKPPIDRLPALASALGVTVDELLNESSVNDIATKEEKAIHGNSRTAKIQDVFEQLPPAKQRQVLSHAKALLGK